MVAQPSRQLMSVEQWRELERASHDAKYEYIDGKVYMMSGGSRAHARIAENIIGILDTVFGDGPCNVYNSDVSVRLSPFIVHVLPLRSMYLFLQNVRWLKSTVALQGSGRMKHMVQVTRYR